MFSSRTELCDGNVFHYASILFSKVGVTNLLQCCSVISLSKIVKHFVTYTHWSKVEVGNVGH